MINLGDIITVSKRSGFSNSWRQKELKVVYVSPQGSCILQLLSVDEVPVTFYHEHYVKRVMLDQGLIYGLDNHNIVFVRNETVDYEGDDDECI